jgi:PEGA domain
VPRKTRIVVLFAGTLAAATVLWPAQAVAQGRAVPRSHPVVVQSSSVYHPYFYRPYYHYPYYYPYYYPYFYAPFYASFYGPWFYAQFPIGYPPYYGYYDNSGAARIQVTPREAQVFIDGYFVGTVDEFDGTFQRLHVAPGEHELTIYLEGYRTIRQKVLFRPGATLKIAHAMEQLPAGEPAEPRPTPDANARPQYPAERHGAPVPVRPSPGAERGDFGAVSIRVQPGDADVFIDGERWEGSATDNRLLVELPEGSHRVEIRKEGFRTYTTTIRVRRGETVSLNVSLTPGPAGVSSMAMRTR